MPAFRCLEVICHELREHLASITAHVELTLGNNVAIVGRCLWHVGHLTDVSSVSEYYVSSCYVRVLQSLCMFFSDEVESRAVIDHHSVEMLTADYRYAPWYERVHANG